MVFKKIRAKMAENKEKRISAAAKKKVTTTASNKVEDAVRKEQQVCLSCQVRKSGDHTSCHH